MLDKFEDIGIDAITVSKLMKYLNINVDDFQDPVRFEQIKDVMTYLKDIPDQSYFVRKIVTGKNVDPLQHVWGYIELSKQRDQKMREAEKTDEQYSMYMRFADEKKVSIDDIKSVSGLSLAREKLGKEIDKINEEMSFYEK